MKILIILALAIAAFLVFSRMRANSDGAAAKTPARTGKKTSAPPRQHPYRATSIVPGDNPCEAVKLLAQKSYLHKDGDTPLLPLADCNAASCTCKYSHRDDRRDIDEDRRLASGMRSELYASGDNEERRTTKRGRRNSDSD